MLKAESFVTSLKSMDIRSIAQQNYYLSMMMKLFLGCLEKRSTRTWFRCVPCGNHLMQPGRSWEIKPTRLCCGGSEAGR